MALYKHKIDFDPAGTDHDKIGSYILGAGGEVATATDLGGGIIALDVNVANITFDADAGVFAEDSVAASADKGQSVLLVRQDTLAISTSATGDYGHFKSTDKGELYVHDVDGLAMLTTIEGDLDSVNTSLTSILADTATIDSNLALVLADTSAILADTATIDSNIALILSDTSGILADTATIDSNIASLVKAEDAAAGDGYNGVAMFAVRNDAGTSLVGTDGDFSALSLNSAGKLWTVSSLDLSGLVADDAVSSENPLLVGAVAHTPAAALSAVSASLDKVHFATDLHRRMWVNDSMAVAWQVSAASVGLTAVQLDATPLATRRKCTVQNLGDKPLYLKNNNTVSTANGIMVPKYSERDLDFAAALPIWGISTAAAQDVRFVEMG